MKRLNAVSGLVLTLAPLLFAGQTAAQGKSATAVLSAPGGRYVFGQISSSREDQYLLDTQTGRVWLVVVQNKTGTRDLVPVPYYPSEGNLPPALPGAAASTQGPTAPEPGGEVDTNNPLLK